MPRPAVGRCPRWLALWAVASCALLSFGCAPVPSGAVPGSCRRSDGSRCPAPIVGLLALLLVVLLQLPAGATNLVLNGDCETGPPSLNGAGASTNLTTTLNAGVHFGGTHSLTLLPQDANSYWVYTLGNSFGLNGIIPGHTYVFSVEASTGSEAIQLFVQSDVGTSVSDALAPTSSGFQLRSITATIPSNAAAAIFLIDCPTPVVPAQAAYFDNFDIEDVTPSPSPGASSASSPVPSPYGVLLAPTLTAEDAGLGNLTLSWGNLAGDSSYSLRFDQVDVAGSTVADGYSTAAYAPGGSSVVARAASAAAVVGYKVPSVGSPVKFGETRIKDKASVRLMGYSADQAWQLASALNDLTNTVIGFVVIPWMVFRIVRRRF